MIIIKQHKRGQISPDLVPDNVRREYDQIIKTAPFFEAGHINLGDYEIDLRNGHTVIYKNWTDEIGPFASKQAAIDYGRENLGRPAWETPKRGSYTEEVILHAPNVGLLMISRGG